MLHLRYAAAWILGSVDEREPARLGWRERCSGFTFKYSFCALGILQ